MDKLLVHIESLNNMEYENIISPLLINYGFHPTIFGKCLIAITEKKICYLAFVDNEESSISEMQTIWQNAKLVEDQQKTLELINIIFNDSREKSVKIPLLVKGSKFQIKVWQALTLIPYGSKVSYENVAEKIGNIKAVRAVATCIAKNNISIIIPCHRVIRKSGKLHKYRWGAEVKKAILTYETSSL